MALGVPVLVLTTFDEDAHLLGALAAGASGYLLKDIESQALIGSIRVTASGGRVVAPNPTQRLIDRAVTSYAGPEPAPPSPDLGLAQREISVALRAFEVGLVEPPGAG